MVTDKELLTSPFVRSVAQKIAAAPRTKVAAAQAPVTLIEALGGFAPKIAFTNLRRARIARALAPRDV